jgi:ADP-heptose:LPS heptosyltransferase
VSGRVLAVCTGGGIGDLLAATPAMSALARTFGAPLTVLASPYAAPIIEGHHAVADILTDDGRARAGEIVETVRRREFTHAVVFWSTARVASIVHRAGIPIRVGQARRLYSWRYTTRVPVRTESGDVTSHWTDVQMDYARALGATPEPEDYRIAVRVRPEDDAEAAAVLARAGIEGGFIVLHAVRGLPLDGVRWPTQAFATIADALGEGLVSSMQRSALADLRAPLQGRPHMPIVLTGAASEADVVGAIGALMRSSHANVAGATSLRGLGALLARATLVVALDSGPAHIAAAVGTPTVAVFALKTDLPNRWRPLGPRVAVIEPSYPCPGCRKETCKTFDCYAALDPASVVAAAQKVLALEAVEFTRPT